VLRWTWQHREVGDAPMSSEVGPDGQHVRVSSLQVSTPHPRLATRAGDVPHGTKCCGG
jgi:hypothetical protein